MKIVGIRRTLGPSVFHSKPVLIMTLDLQDLTEVPSTAVDGFTDRLVNLMPSLQQHKCSIGTAGGFVERLRRGTYFGHIVEHIALELHSLAGGEAKYGKTVYAGKLGLYNVAVRFEVEEAMEFALRQAVDVAYKIAKEQSVDIDEIVDKCADLYKEYALGPSTSAILAAAELRNIPTRVIDGSLLQLGYGAQRKFVEAAVTHHTSAIGVDIVSNKALTKLILAELSLPVPRGTCVTNIYDALEFLDRMGGPLVVKPVDGNHGRAVTLGVESHDALVDAFERASMVSRKVIIEEQVHGLDYRVLVVNGKVVAAAQRTPAHVIGDGCSTLSRLVELENRNANRASGHAAALSKIVVDESAKTCVEAQRLSLTSVVEKGRRVYLCWAANLSAGGTAEDVTGRVHPAFLDLCVRAAQAVNVDVCGVDLIAEDISRHPADQRAAIIELNASPGLRMHLSPSVGLRREVGRTIVDSLYPQGDGRIPIVAVTGTNGKTTVTRMIERVMSLSGYRTGMTTSDGIYIDGRCIEQGDTTGGRSARSILGSSQVEVAVLECARGGLLKRGLGFDWCDVGVLTNIGEDHIGQDGIESIDDILNIKSLIAERVKVGGTVVFNADDPTLVRYARVYQSKFAGRDVIFTSMLASNPTVTQLVESGGRACVLKQSRIVLLSSDEEQVIVDVRDIPLTFNGTANFHIANCLSAAAASFVHGIPLEKIREGLCSFDRNEDNLGRTNLYMVGKQYLMLDYGHNPAAFQAVAEMTRHWGFSHIVGVIGVPGDRADSLIRLSAAVVAQGFDEIVLREDDDLRGRESGEVSALLRASIHQVNPKVKCTTLLDEREAVRSALASPRNELVVVFYDELENLEDLLEEVHAEPLPIRDFVDVLKSHETRHATQGEEDPWKKKSQMRQPEIRGA